MLDLIKANLKLDSIEDLNHTCWRVGDLYRATVDSDTVWSQISWDVRSHVGFAIRSTTTNPIQNCLVEDLWSPG